MWWGNNSLCMGLGSHDQDAATPIYMIKTPLKSSQDCKADELKTWYAALGSQALPSLSK